MNVLPNLPAAVEILASLVMIASVLGALWSLRGEWTGSGEARTRGPKIVINPRHIQFVSVGLIVPTILILGLEKVLTSETTATLIGGLAGYLLSGIGRYEPRPRSPKDKHSDSGVSKGGTGTVGAIFDRTRGGRFEFSPADKPEDESSNP